MTTTKHTPAPWEAITNQNGNTIIRTTCWNESAGTNCLRIIASDLYDESNEPELAELEANARLIAAAPDMLAALQNMVTIWEGDRAQAAVKFAAQVVLARAAISRATQS